MVSSSRGSTLTPCKSPTPEIPVQPDHFYGTENVQLPPSPDSDGKTWLDPADDPMAHRGIPVFKPTMEEFKDFEGYMNRVECWGSKSGIIKVIPPKEWTASLPAIKPQLAQVKIKSPIEQHMLGNAGLFRQENMEKRKLMSVREWVELCSKDEFRAPGVFDVGLTSRGANIAVRSKTQRKGKQKAGTVEAELAGPANLIKEEPLDECLGSQSAATPPHSGGTLTTTAGSSRRKKASKDENPKPRAKRAGPTREAREASLANRAALDRSFIEDFSPHKEWLPSNTEPTDYTPEFCQKLERQFWRNCGLGKPAWYGADSQGSLFTDATTAWNVAHLPSTLSRLLPSDQGLPGVNTPYLYFGMWRATFAWHVEDMDLFSINYIHFGAPKFWYAIPQGRAAAMEQTMRGYFPKDTSQCPQFLRHKSFLASPSILANSACRPNYLVQQSGEFVVTFPRGYHAGFNLGLNCAESVNFALESWLDIGRRAKACECISDSVRIDVDELLRQREEERNESLEDVTLELATTSPKKDLVKEEIIDILLPPSKSRKRKSEAKDGDTMAKKFKVKPSMTIGPPKAPLVKLSVTLKLGPRPVEPEPFPCCLCVSMGKEGLLRVHDPPTNRRDAVEATGNPKSWMAHDQCANIVPETWVDDLDSVDGGREKVVFGVDGIVKDRWNLKCSACTKTKSKAHGAPVQCTKGKCPKAFHVNCARDGHALGIMFTVMREVEKEVVLIDPSPPSSLTDNRSESMNVDSNHTTNDLNVPTPIVQSTLSHVLKVIKKLDVQILCTQHNPAVAAQKKASKQDKIRNDLLALPSMARIKIRVSSGVFEVSLIRVIEETSSVEVLWDRGVKREFKWGSVVFGSTDGPVQQKPSEIMVESERPVQCAPVSTFPSVAAATSQQPLQPTGLGNLPAAPTGSTAVTTGTTVNQQYSAGTTPYMYSLRTGPFDYWAYASQYSNSQGNQTQYPYTYNGYYPTTQTAGIAQNHNPYTYTQTYAQNQNRSNQLNWQRPYQGPSTQEGSSMAQGTGTIHRFRLGPNSQSPSGRQSPAQTSSSTQQQSQCQSSSNQLPSSSTSSEKPAALEDPNTSESLEKSSSLAVAAAAELSTSSDTVGGIVEQVSVHKDLSVLSSLQPSQIAEILCNNPEIQSIVWAAVDQAMTKARNEAA